MAGWEILNVVLVEVDWVPALGEVWVVVTVCVVLAMETNVGSRLSDKAISWDSCCCWEGGRLIVDVVVVGVYCNVAKRVVWGCCCCWSWEAMMNEPLLVGGQAKVSSLVNATVP